MNYYNPNFYQNYPYSNNNQYLQQMQQQYQTQMNPGLNGKIVDSADMVKATEVPIGGYGIFPKADLSEIYIKNWNSNGTTNILTFKPYVSPEPVEKDIVDNSMNKEILDRISILEGKLDTILQAASGQGQPQVKKGASANDY